MANIVKPLIGAAIGLGATSLVLQSTRMLPRYKQKRLSKRRVKNLMMGGALLGAFAASSVK